MANTSGVFTLDELRALGQTGDIKKDWLAGGKTGDSLIAGGGRAVISGNLPKGYYNIPGFGSYFYDPASGQVAPEFQKWASGNIERDPITGVPKALMYSGDAGDFARSQYDQSKQTIETLDKIIGEHAAGATYQQAQDKTLGIGQYQTGVIGSDGRVIPIGSSSTGGGGYRDYSKNTSGAFDKLLGLSGKTQAELDKILGLKRSNSGMANFWTKQADALASNYMTNAEKAQGLQELRAARGLDPNTGISDAEKARIWETYNRIQDPAERAAYIKAQDPGNLVPELRQARLNAGGGTSDSLYKKMVKAEAPQYEYHQASEFGAPEGDHGQIKLTIGGKSFVDKATGREAFVGNIPVSAEYIAPSKSGFEKWSEKTFVGQALGRVEGAVHGFAEGMVSGAGNPIAGIAGAARGAGAPLGVMLPFIGVPLGLFKLMGGNLPSKLRGFGSWDFASTSQLNAQRANTEANKTGFLKQTGSGFMMAFALSGYRTAQGSKGAISTTRGTGLSNQHIPL